MQDTWVLNVWANDGDDDPISNQFDTASSTAPFAIDSGSGDITVNGVPDAATQPEYTLTAQAVDPAGSVGSTTVTIDVTAVNNPPEVVDDSYSVDENDVLTVDAVDGVWRTTPTRTAICSRCTSIRTRHMAFWICREMDRLATRPTQITAGYDGFYYYVSDGNQNSDVAYVEIDVLDTSTNTPPKPMTTATASVRIRP